MPTVMPSGRVANLHGMFIMKLDGAIVVELSFLFGCGLAVTLDDFLQSCCAAWYAVGGTQSTHASAEVAHS